MSDLNSFSYEKCIHFLEEAGCEGNVIDHCKAVHDLAMKIANGIIEHSTASGEIQINLSLVTAGSLLHDIGRSRTHAIQHGDEGGRLLGHLNAPEELINIVERHIGAGLNASESAELGLPNRDHIPITIEEKIVAHADNLIGENGRRDLESVIKRLMSKGKPDAAERIKALHFELSGLYGSDVNQIKL